MSEIQMGTIQWFPGHMTKTRRMIAANLSLVDAVVAMHLNKTLFCLVVAIILLIFGTFMEGTAIAVLLVPVLWPIAQSMGIDVIHFGMIVCISNVVGTMTPPVAASSR